MRVKRRGWDDMGDVVVSADFHEAWEGALLHLKLWMILEHSNRQCAACQRRLQRMLDLRKTSFKTIPLRLLHETSVTSAQGVDTPTRGPRETWCPLGRTTRFKAILASHQFDYPPYCASECLKCL